MIGENMPVDQMMLDQVQNLAGWTQKRNTPIQQDGKDARDAVITYKRKYQGWHTLHHTTTYNSGVPSLYVHNNLMVMRIQKNDGTRERQQRGSGNLQITPYYHLSSGHKVHEGVQQCRRLQLESKMVKGHSGKVLQQEVVDTISVLLIHDATSTKDYFKFQPRQGS